MRYRVQHNYGAYSDGKQFGPWQAGAEIELDDVDAEWVLRDSPGALEPAGESKAAAKPAKRAGSRRASSGDGESTVTAGDDDL